MGLIPVNKRVIVKPDPLEEAQMYSSLLITPESHTRAPTTGKVVQIFNGCTEIKKGKPEAKTNPFSPRGVYHPAFGFVRSYNG